jgi:phosphoribosyl 1,2-cyclic phosphodiesterase
MKIDVLASGSSGNAYRVSDGKTALLLDAGIPYKRIQQALHFRMRDIAGTLITHCHFDHCKAVPHLLGAGADVYASRGTIEARGWSGHRIHTVKALKGVGIGSWKVIPFDVEHDAPEPLGFQILSCATGENLLYFTDTYYIRYRFDGLTHIMGEANYDFDNLKKSIELGYIPAVMAPRIIKSHMSLEHFIDLLKANDLSKLRQVYLLHLSANNSDAERYKREVQEATGAEVYIA